MSRGFTLIETILYIALFSIIIFGGFVTAFQLIQGTAALNSRTVKESEINFVLRKINYTLTGITSTTLSGYSPTLSVTKYDGNKIDIRLQDEKIEIRESAGANVFLPITTENVKVSKLLFRYLPSDGVEAAITINGTSASTTKYLRK